MADRRHEGATTTYHGHVTETEPNITRHTEPVNAEPVKASSAETGPVRQVPAVDVVAESDAQRATFAQLRAGAPTELPSSNYTVPIAAAGIVGLLLLVVAVILRRRR